MSLGLPYMGSKRKIASNILSYITANNPEADTLYDLFGGGGAISFTACLYPQFKKVVYNELNTGVVELLRKIKSDGVTKEFYQWVDRETFHKHKNDDTWFGGLVKTCWSFGNNQITYLFGDEAERLKRPLHEIIVNLDLEVVEEFEQMTGLLIPIDCLDCDTINERRLKVTLFMEKIESGFKFQNFINIERLSKLPKQLTFDIQNKSYEQVEIIGKSPIIYLDIPYQTKASLSRYKNESSYYLFDYNELESYIANSPHKIYLSSYDCPAGMFEVDAISHRSILSATANNKIVERLFCNREENNQMYLF